MQRSQYLAADTIIKTMCPAASSSLLLQPICSNPLACLILLAHTCLLILAGHPVFCVCHLAADNPPSELPSAALMRHVTMTDAAGQHYNCSIPESPSQFRSDVAAQQQQVGCARLCLHTASKVVPAGARSPSCPT